MSFLSRLVLLVALLSLATSSMTPALAPSFSWNIEMVNAPSAWEKATGAGVVVAMLDSGLDLDHEDLVNKLWSNTGEIPNNGVDDDGNGYADDINGYDFVDNDGMVDGETINSHGTATSGVLVRNAPNVRIMTVRILDDQNGLSGSDLATIFAPAVRYAVDNGAKVICMPIGIAISLPTELTDAFQYAYGRNVTLVAVTGNGGLSTVNNPGRDSRVIAVGAVDQYKRLATWESPDPNNPGEVIVTSSNTGPETELAAPGKAILTSAKGGGTRTVDGTSVATSVVAAQAALLYELFPDISSSRLRTVMQHSATDVGTDGRDEEFGYGVPNFDLALRVVADEESPILLETLHDIQVVDASSGKLSFRFHLDDLSGIKSASLGYRLITAEPYGSWRSVTTSTFSGVPFQSSSTTTDTFANVSIDVKGSLVQYFATFQDWAGGSFKIGSQSSPLTFATGLVDPSTSSTPPNTETSTSSSQSPSLPPQSELPTSSQQGGEYLPTWLPESSEGVDLPLVGLVAIPLLAIRHRRRNG